MLWSFHFKVIPETHNTQQQYSFFIFKKKKFILILGCDNLLGKRLRKGDTIGLISPSGAQKPEKTKKSLYLL